MAQAAQIDLLCPTCAGQRRFDPTGGGLICDSCGATQVIAVPPDHDAGRERPFDPDTPQLEQPQTHSDLTQSCQTCGGQVVFRGAALSERCPYCDGPVVQGPQDFGFDTMALIPFAIDADRARANARAWLQSRWAAPTDLADQADHGRFAGLYAPFWTFDSEEAVQYWAQYSRPAGKGKRAWRKTKGRMQVRFDDLLVPASPHITPLIRDGILHEFDPNALVPYAPNYLAGFAAERHHQTVAEGLAANEADKDLLLRHRIKAHVSEDRLVGENHVRVDRYLTDTSGIHYRRILLPAWILHYSIQGVAYRVVVSGIDGRTYGQRPFSTRKLLGLSAIATGLLVLTGLLYGALGLP